MPAPSDLLSQPLQHNSISQEIETQNMSLWGAFQIQTVTINTSKIEYISVLCYMENGKKNIQILHVQH